jgi:hypothetical protein
MRPVVPVYRRRQHLRFNLHRLPQALGTLVALFTIVLVTKLTPTDATRTGNNCISLVVK